MNLKILVVSWLGVEGLRHAPQTTTQTTTTTTTRGKVQRNEDKMRPMRRRRRYRGRALEFSTQAADTPKSLELSAEAAIRGVVQRAAEALRDGWRQVDLPSGAAAFQTLVSTENNASELSPTELAAAIERHRSIYGPLLAFDQVTEVSVTVESTNSAIATTRLVGDGESSIVSWTLSRNDRGQWLIDDVGLIQADAPLDLDLDAAFTPSPSWVAHTVLNALRKVDEPDPNHGCDVALSYVSDDNPSSSLTREIFRSYLDDENYPYVVPFLVSFFTRVPSLGMASLHGGPTFAKKPTSFSTTTVMTSTFDAPPLT